MSSLAKPKTAEPAASGTEVREMIIRSAGELFEKNGYNNVKISDITDQIGMTTGAFYYYFQNKEEVLQIVSSYYIKIAADLAKATVERRDLDAKERLTQLIRQHCVGIARHHSNVSIFYRELRNLSDEGLERAVHQNKKFLHYTTELIQQGASEGIFRKDLDPKISALAIIGMCNWLYQWYSPHGQSSIEQIAEIFIRLTLDGLIARDDGPARLS